MTNSLWRLWLALQLLCAGAVALSTWGLAAVMVIGFAVNPSALARTFSNGSPTAPWQVAVVLVLLVLGAGGVTLARSVVRRSSAPRPAHPVKKASTAQNQPARRGPSRRSAVNLRTRLFLLAALLLAGIALLASMVTEWMGQEQPGFGGPGTLLTLAAFSGSFVVGVAFAKRLTLWRAERADDPIFLAGDGRPVLALIWWPITVVSTAVPLLALSLNALHGVEVGSGLPAGIVALVGVFGFISLPAVVSESRAEFGARGVRGLWRAIRMTQWGDGSA